MAPRFAGTVGLTSTPESCFAAPRPPLAAGAERPGGSAGGGVMVAAIRDAAFRNAGRYRMQLSMLSRDDGAWTATAA